MVYKKNKISVRHLLSRLWHLTDSTQTLILKLIFRKGLTRNIEDIGEIYVCHECRKLAVLPLAHEANWWRRLTQEIRPGDTIVDVGAYIGIFTVIMAKKTGGTGKVLAFEPHPERSAIFQKNIQLNGVSGQVEFFDLAIGEEAKPLLLDDQGSKSQIVSSASSDYTRLFTVESRPLDEILENRKIDILKIDTEGYEENVIRGAKNLLRRKIGYPRFIFIECHPLKWHEFGANSKDIMAILQDAGYAVEVPETEEHVGLDSLRGSWVIFATRNN